MLYRAGTTLEPLYMACLLEIALVFIFCFDFALNSDSVNGVCLLYAPLKSVMMVELCGTKSAHFSITKKTLNVHCSVTYNKLQYEKISVFKYYIDLAVR